jgi:hypothetical protein
MLNQNRFLTTLDAKYIASISDFFSNANQSNDMNISKADGCLSMIFNKQLNMNTIIPSFLIKDVLKNRFVFFYIEMYSQITQTIYVILTILFNKLYFSKDETYDGK